MNTSAKRAFSALATVAVVAVTVLGIVGLTAVPVSAATITLSGPTTGHVDEELTYTAYVTNDGVPVNGYGVDFARRDLTATGLQTDYVEFLYTDAQGKASRSYTFDHASRYEISAIGADSPRSNNVYVTVTEATPSVQAKIDLSGPTTGEEDKALTYSARFASIATDSPINGAAIDFTVYDAMNIVATQRAITDQEGRASASFTIQQPGSYSVVARVVGNADVVNHLDVTITAADGGSDRGGQPTGGGSGQTGGDATTAKTTNASVAGLEDIAAQAEAVTGLGSNSLLIVLAIAGIILLAIIAAALLMRRRGEDEYEYEEEGP